MKVNNVGGFVHNGVCCQFCVYPPLSHTRLQAFRIASVKALSRPLSTTAKSNNLPYHQRRHRSVISLVTGVTRRCYTKMTAGYLPVYPQAVDAPLTRHATFLVLTVNRSQPDVQSTLSTVRSTLASVSDLTKNVSIRDLSAQFACTVGIGANVWNEITNRPQPKELHVFPEVKGQRHTAVSTPGDLLFHIRAERQDLCFDIERQLMELLGDSVILIDETAGFRYFDVRDLLGFVDGTANPVGTAVPDSTVITAEDDSAAEGGSYVVVQKYLHDLEGWRGLQTEKQEAIIGRTEFDNVELGDAADDVQKAHKQLATVEEDGQEFDILRASLSLPRYLSRADWSFFPRDGDIVTPVNAIPMPIPMPIPFPSAEYTVYLFILNLPY